MGAFAARPQNELRTAFHRHETTDGVLTWTVPVGRTTNGRPTYARPRDFELNDKPLDVSEGRALKLRHNIVA
jgi:hypothetical protein